MAALAPWTWPNFTLTRFPPRQAKECMLFAGSAVASGAGSGVVTATGMATEIGKIQSDIQVGRARRSKFGYEFGALTAGSPARGRHRGVWHAD